MKHDDPKNDLRFRLKKTRQGLPLEFQHQASKKICAHINTLKVYHQAKDVALYQAIQGEINLNSLWHETSAGKIFYFPVITPEKTLIFLPATPTTEFQTNQYKILEPHVDFSQAIAIEKLDILFLPLLAFDKQGTRLGMGGGYYDRSLALHQPKLLIGVAYDFQYQPRIHCDTWDVALHAIITPSQIYWSTPPCAIG